MGIENLGIWEFGNLGFGKEKEEEEEFGRFMKRVLGVGSLLGSFDGFCDWRIFVWGVRLLERVCVCFWMAFGLLVLVV